MQAKQLSAKQRVHIYIRHARTYAHNWIHISQPAGKYANNMFAIAIIQWQQEWQQQ